MSQIFVFVLIFVPCVQNARILVAMPTPSYSHHIVFNPLWLALHDRGHHVTLLTTNPIPSINSTNFRQIDWGFAYALWHEKHKISEIIMNFRQNFPKFAVGFIELMKDIHEEELKCDAVQRIINDEEEHFDLVIAEILYPVMMAFSYRFQAPLIGVASMDLTSFVHELMGNPVSPGVYSDFLTAYDNEMSFFQRIMNTFYYFGIKLIQKYIVFPELDQMIEKYFGKNYPTLEAQQQNVDLVLISSNPIIQTIRPLVSNFFLINGGAHLHGNTTLPKDIQLFLENAKSGVIYFSLGTNVLSKDLPQNLVKSFLEVFEELPYRVIWKFENKDIASNSKILVKKWLPQQEILRHSNIKLFITQGGLQSLEEAIYNAIPIIGIPFLFDQFPNVQKTTKKGLGLYIDYLNFNKQQLKNAILDVINNPRYKATALELSTLIKEQPFMSLNKTLKKVEYLLKYKEATILKPHQVPLYQYLLLDILGTCAVLLSFFGFLVLKLISKLRCNPKM